MKDKNGVQGLPCPLHAKHKVCPPIFKSGPNNIAVALFSFPSLAAYEEYRQAIETDSECQAAFAFAEQTRCIVSYERSFMRPVLE